MSDRLSATDLIDLVLDDGSFALAGTRPRCAGRSPRSTPPSWPPRSERTGLDESVITGEGRMRGRRVAVVACEFGFLAGSIGVGVGRAAGRAPSSAPPPSGCRCSPRRSSGGTRMQEGTVAFVQMVKISAAIAAHKKAGLPYLVYLRHPTTGGVMASWGSLGHVTVAEPGALVGFLGPRVYEALYDRTFPEGVQTSENLYAHGLIDGVVPHDQVADILDRALTVLTARRRGAGRRTQPARRRDRRRGHLGVGHPVAASGPARRTPAAEVRRHRRDPAQRHRPGRVGPGAADRAGAVRRARRASSSARTGAARPRRTRSGRARCARPAAGMRLAAELHLPLMTVIDTPGAALSVEAEEGGLAGEIARCLADLVTLDAPDAVPAARRGQRRRRARAAARRPGGRRPARLALAAAARGRQRDRAPRPRPRPGHGARPGRALARPAAQPASSTGSSPSGRTPRTSRRSSAAGSRTCCASSWPR